MTITFGVNSLAKGWVLEENTAFYLNCLFKHKTNDKGHMKGEK